MLKNYLKIAFRNLWKHKGYSFINILGLAFGLASCIIILLYVTHELSYDKQHKKADRIFRIASKIDFSGNYLELATAPAPMGPTLKRDYPEVEEIVRFRPRGNYLVRLGESNIKESRVVFADASVFKVFTIPMLHGDPKTALLEPHTVAISQSTARKYFGREDVVGETMLLDDETTFKVTGVYKDIPVTSHFHFDFLLSMPTIAGEANNAVWLSNNFRTYLLLKEGTDPEEFAQNFDTIKKTYIEPQLQQFMGVKLEEFKAAGNSVKYDLQPLTSIHLYSNLTAEFEANGSIIYVYIFSGLALFILILACINFMNLATARSVQRAKEVGIRKALGSVRRQLAMQFLAESLLVSMLSFLIALLLVEISLPYFSNLAGITITSGYLTNPGLLSYIALIVIATGFFAGSYPALMLSGFKPVNVLKGVFVEGRKQSIFRSALVVFQFSISIIIIVGLLVINKQLSFIQDQDIGFQRDQVIIVHDAYALGSDLDVYKKKMLGYPVFKSATLSSFIPVSGFASDDRTYWPKGETRTQENTISMNNWRADENYIDTFGMEIIAGRNFSKERGTDANTVILNEVAVNRFGFEDPIGRVIHSFALNRDGTFDKEHLMEFKIIGVVKNFHYKSLRQNIEALGLFYGRSTGSISFKIAAPDASDALQQLEKNWVTLAPSQPFSYSFLDQRFDQMYRSENRTQKLMSVFSILAALIACLGLFGLSAYSTEQRTKEIGIRKVLGATVTGIVSMMSKEFLRLVLISLLVAIPVSYLIMQQWLQEFVYRTPMGLDVFLWAGAGAMLVALLTVSWQSIRAALANPIESLRSE